MFKRSWLMSLPLLFLIFLGIITLAWYTPHYIPGTTGYDISWPNCHASVPKTTDFGIVGVTYGKNYTINPCLSNEIAKFHTYQLYMNTGNVEYDINHRSTAWPKKCSPIDHVCLSYNYGYGASTYALKVAAFADIHSSVWWLDVETENTWSNDTKANVAVLEGMIAAIHHQTIHTTIGIYAYPGQWKLITGGWKPGLPAWVATSKADRAHAVAACYEPSFTSGPVVLTQYTDELDRDYVCGSAIN
jgi:hypothetical protein